MKRLNLLFAALVCACFCSAAKAQIIYTPVNPYQSNDITMLNLAMDNTRAVAARNAMMSAALAANGARSNQQIWIEKTTALGTAKIKAGKASVRFVSTAAATAKTAGDLNWNGNLTDNKPAQIEYIQKSVKDFKTRMITSGFVADDWADAYVFALALSHEAFYDEKMDSAELQQKRKAFRQEKLSSAFFQGVPETEKQFIFEKNVVMAMQAINSREKFRTAKAIAEKNEAEKEAIEFGAILLNVKPDGSERGERIIKAGKAAPTFERIEQSLLAEQYATADYKFMEKDAAYFAGLLQKFDREVERRGGATNDAAVANAVAIAVNYYILSDGQTRLNDQQYKWALTEMQKDIASNVSYQNSTNKQKQEYYEYLGIKAMMTLDKFGSDTEFLKNIGSPILQDSYKSSFVTAWGRARTNLQDLFQPRNFNEYELTETGFVKKQ